MTDKQRAAFEAWASGYNVQMFIDRSRHDKSLYAHAETNDAWAAWQAGIEHAETRMNRAGRSDSEIELPALPEAEIDDAGAFMSDAQVMTIESAKEYARLSVEHDRKRNDNWRHAVMCAISHNDYETDAPRRVQQALRLLSDAFHGLPFRESIVDDLIADRQRRGEPTAAEISDVIREITGCPDIKNGEDSLVVALGMLFHRCATTQSSEPTIDAPAQVGNVRFGKGVKQSTVIAAAQRHHAYMNTPEKERERIRKGAEFLKELRDLYTAPQPAEPVKANDWRYDAMCATSHLDYESGAPHEVCQALRVLRAALSNEPYDAYLSVPLGPTQPAEPVKCPDPSMGHLACNDRSQCWEPCGELGKSAEHAKVAEPVKVPSDDDSLTIAYMSGYHDGKRSMTPEGWQLVPKELIDFLDAKEHHLPVEDRHVLSAMLAAAPEPPCDT